MAEEKDIISMDFSDTAVKKAVRANGLYHPVSKWFPALGILCGFAGWAFSFWSLYPVALVLILAGIANAGIRMFVMKDKVVLEFKRKERKALELQAANETRLLETALERLGMERAAQQVVQLKKTFLHYRKRLSEKFESENAIFDQFITAAEDMYLQAIENLKAIRDLTKDLAITDAKKAQQAIETLNRTEPDSLEIPELKKRIEKHEEIMEHIKQLRIAVIETINMLLDQTTGLSDLKSSEELGEMSLDFAKKKFQEVADRNRRLNEERKTAARTVMGDVESIVDLSDFEDMA